MKNRIRELTEQLVGISSVNGTSGEADIADFLFRTIQEIPYFQKHPGQVFTAPLKRDSLKRKNVFALLKGERGDKADTILLHGHIDTVGVEDYGSLKPFAFAPRKLEEMLAGVSLPEDVKQDLESGEYLFGRGACDMKSGDAVFVWLLERLSEQVRQLSGNILVMFNPVEENMHTGVQESLDVLLDFKRREGLEYLLAINNDYTCPLYPGDPNRYLYTGAVGKLLPCFYVRGCETHVGQSYEGFSASLLASELVRDIDLNPEFCDVYDGECSLPPVVLKLRDLKDFYNVQTAKEAFAYFNYMVHGASVSEITQKLREAAERSFEECIALQTGRHRKFCERSGTEYKERKIRPRVITYADLLKSAKAQYGERLEPMLSAKLEELTQQNMDSRTVSMELVRHLANLVHAPEPMVVLFYAPPYCPHTTLKHENPDEEQLFSKLKNLAREFEEIARAPFQVLHFFPSLSDSSYLNIDDDDESVESLVGNFPAQKQLYPIPLEEIRELSIPAVNFGVYGKDAHKWTERVYMPYSFECLPKILVRTVEELFGDQLET